MADKGTGIRQAMRSCIIDKVAKLRMEGKTYEEIAVDLGIPICYEVRELLCDTAEKSRQKM